jgi:hypothetical protein
MVIAHHILLFYPLSLPLAIGNFIYLYFCRPLEIRKLALSPLLRSWFRPYGYGNPAVGERWKHINWSTDGHGILCFWWQINWIWMSGTACGCSLACFHLRSMFTYSGVYILYYGMHIFLEEQQRKLKYVLSLWVVVWCSAWGSKIAGPFNLGQGYVRFRQ